MPQHSPLNLLVPRNATATLQLLQRLVGRENHRYWCGGPIATHKVPGFVQKMAARYPAILRNTRERSYDRHRLGRAAMHLIVCPPIGNDPHVFSPMLHWWLLSDGGAGGLADPASPDAHVAGEAMSSDTHVLAGSDYVLLYASKRVPRSVKDRRTGQVRRIWSGTSTWTWKLRSNVMGEIRVAIDACCASQQLGAEPAGDGRGWGLRGLLAAQRARPLFSGVRNQVIELHRYAASEAWPPYKLAWLSAHPQIASTFDPRAANPLSAREVMEILPKLRQLRTYDTPRRTIGDLLVRPIN